MVLLQSKDKSVFNALKIKRSGIRIAMDVVSFIAAYCFYYCLLLFMFYFMYQAGNCDFEPITLLPTVFIFYLVHEAIRIPENPWISGILAVVVCVVTVLYYPLEELFFLPGVILTIFAFIEFFSREKKIDKSGLGENWFIRIRNRIWGTGIVVVMILHMVLSARNTQRAILPSYCLYLMCLAGCVYILMVFLHKYLKIFHQYFRRKKRISSVMNAQVKRVLVFAGTLAAGIGVLIFLFSQYFSQWLTVIFKKLVEWISGIKIMDPIDTSSVPIEHKTPVTMSERNEIAIRAVKGASAFGQFLAFVFMLIVAAIIIYCIVMLLRNLSKFRFVSEATGEYSVEWQEMIISKENGKRSLFRHGDSNNERIRKYYYRMLLQQRKKGRLKKIGTMTTADIEKEISFEISHKDSVEEFTPIYDSARYSAVSSSKEDVDKAKELLHRLKNVK